MQTTALRSVTPEEAEVVTLREPYSCASKERIPAVRHAADYVARAEVPGAFVECGVYRGGCSMAAVPASGPQRLRNVIRGTVEDTVPRKAPESIAIRRLDTDWYASTRHEMEHLFPRLSRGGVLIIDDYGHWAGSRQAVDQVFKGHGVHMLLGRTAHTERMGIKV